MTFLLFLSCGWIVKSDNAEESLAKNLKTRDYFSPNGELK